MIFKYPEEFIVPIVYVQDLKDKTFYRLQESKSLKRDEELKENEIFLAKADIYGGVKNKHINFFKMDEEILQEPIINEDIVEADLEDENTKNILSDIDEDYANSETLNMKV
ncbi:hypothetical protein psyc5s11_08740 [Clostridium gelidum]|uniref:Uncharacterized protein n=1 Tax=Clostridium gelidum TaxID=704125 RepID=A0ABM7T1Q4_9CLOT|nr:hypothetical protein [Clostridium gelidum]BCZ44807.1 hypothetical protein psyc5s11_08740 [Clostridium gelidum]